MCDQVRCPRGSDVFLVLFLFVLGANLDLLVARAVLLPAIGLGAILLVVKPVLSRALSQAVGETKEFAQEAGLRLGQASEFSLAIAVFALKAGVLSEHASQLVQLATITTMVVSSYLVVLKLPTPLGTRKGLQRD